MSVIVGTGLVLVTGLAVLSVCVGAVSVAASDVLSAIGRGLSGEPLSRTDYLVWQLRVARVVQALLVGAGLALAGLVVQVLVRNPIADPYVLGTASGAGLGAVVVITSAGVAAGITVSLGALIGALIAGLLVAAAAGGAGGLGAQRLVLVGVALGQLFGGAMSFLILRADDPDAAQVVLYWLLGSISNAHWSNVWLALPTVVCSFVVLLILQGKLDALALGDDLAAALGHRPGRARAILFVIAAALTAIMVSISGTIGFVGFVVPNLARLLVGGLHRRLLPVSALLGALLVLGADTAARVILAPAEVPIGILTAAIGVPLFVLVLRRGMRAGT